MPQLPSMLPALEAAAQDFRHAAGGMLRARGFSLLVTAVLAVGIGASITVFSILNTLFLRPLPYPHPEQLVMIGGAYTRGQQVGPMAPVRYLDYLEWKKQSQSFAGIAAYKSERFVVNVGGEPQRVRGERVDSGYFELLGVRPMLGRGFAPEEYVAGAPAVLALSEEYWRRTLNGRADVIGMTMRVDGVTATVVGVMRGGIRATLIEGGPKLWSPLIPTRAELAYERGSVAVLARLAGGVSILSARAEMAVIGKRLADEHPLPDRDPAVRVDGLQATLEWAATAPVVKVLVMAVVCLLLISCVNASCLLLGRAAERQKEVALRGALGAGRARLIRQFFAESSVFALAGGIAGVGLAWMGIAWCTAKMGPLLVNEGIDGFVMDGRVLGFALLVACAVALIFGVLPALRGSRVDLVSTLKEGGAHSSSVSRMRLTGVLVAVEVALSVVLVTSGGLLLYSIQQYWRFDWGVPLDHRVAMQVAPMERTYDTDAKLIHFYGQLLTRARELPGVESAALVNAMPLHMGAYSVGVKSDASEGLQAGYRVISPGYHSTAGLPLRAGRMFTETDTTDHPQVALVSESLARKLWPGKQAIGQRVYVGESWRTVVGITGDLPQSLMKGSNHEICVPYMQSPPKTIRVLVRIAGDPAAVTAAFRGAVRTVDPDLPLSEVQTLRATKEALGARFEFIMGLLCSFAVAAMVLAGAGIYGVTSRSVAARTREIGIRMALGADPQRMLRHVLRGGLKLTLAGTLAGSALAFLMIKVLLTKIWWLSPVSALSWIAPVAVLMALLAVTSSLMPARRATRIATTSALKAE